MTVKVEMKRLPEKGVIALAFECSTTEEHEILDAVRTAMLGDFEMRWNYIHSNRLVFQIKENDFEPSTVSNSPD